MQQLLSFLLIFTEIFFVFVKILNNNDNIFFIIQKIYQLFGIALKKSWA